MCSMMSLSPYYSSCFNFSAFSACQQQTLVLLAICAEISAFVFLIICYVPAIKYTGRSKRMSIGAKRQSVNWSLREFIRTDRKHLCTVCIENCAIVPSYIIRSRSNALLCGYNHQELFSKRIHSNANRPLMHIHYLKEPNTIYLYINVTFAFFFVPWTTTYLWCILVTCMRSINEKCT